MLGYLNITHLEVSLLLNFKAVKLKWKRIVNDRPAGLGQAADNEGSSAIDL